MHDLRFVLVCVAARFFSSLGLAASRRFHVAPRASPLRRLRGQGSSLRLRKRTRGGRLRLQPNCFLSAAGGCDEFCLRRRRRLAESLSSHGLGGGLSARNSSAFWTGRFLHRFCRRDRAAASPAAAAALATALSASSEFVDERRQSRSIAGWRRGPNGGGVAARR